MHGYCTKCSYKTEEKKRKRDINKQIELDRGKWAIYMNKNNICPQCRGKDTLKFKVD